MTYQDTISELFPFTANYRSGSREICSPAPEGTDEDWIILVGNMNSAIKILSESGFETTTEQQYQGMLSPFQS